MALRANSGNQKDRDLEMLEVIERSPNINQRVIASETKMALGLVNSCLKRLARKGWIKISAIPPRRYLYYLTPKGMTEKTRLTYEYVRCSIHFYREARRRCRREFHRLAERGVTSVALLGNGDLAEIAYLTLQEFPIKFVALYDRQAEGLEFFGRPARLLSGLRTEPADYQALIYTGVQAPSAVSELAGIQFIEIF